jgi:hypothetical protein
MQRLSQRLYDLEGKLINVVPAVTSQRFVINQDHKAYQHLVELIRIRNKLVHNRSSVFEEHTATWKEGPGGKAMLSLPEGLNELDRLDTQLSMVRQLGQDRGCPQASRRSGGIFAHSP